MTDKITLAPVGSLLNATTAQTTINNNFSLIQSTLDSFLSLNGTPPNQMSSVIDMNGNRIINLASPGGPTDPLRFGDVTVVPPGGIVYGSPSNKVGLTAVNGVSTLVAHADSAPALDTTIAPSWTGQHNFSLMPTVGGISIIPVGAQNQLVFYSAPGQAIAGNPFITTDASGDLFVAGLIKQGNTKAVQTTQTSVSGSNVPLTDLTFSVVSGNKYIWDFQLIFPVSAIFGGGGSNNLLVTTSGSANTSLYTGNVTFIIPGVTNSFNPQGNTGAPVTGGQVIVNINNGSAADSFATGSFYFVCSGSGTLGINLSQNTPSATATKCAQGSWARLMQV